MLDDGSIAFVEIAGQRVSRVDSFGGRITLAQVPGGPNGMVLGPDGNLYICNNGGLRWHLNRPDRNLDGLHLLRAGQ